MTLHTARIAAVLLFASSAQAAEPPTDQLLDGVNSINSGGNPASLIAWGDAHPIVVGPKGDVFAAASELGRGRIVALGHGGFVGIDDPETARFIANSIEWLANGAAPARIHGLKPPAENELNERGFQFEKVDARPRTLDFSTVDVLIGSPQAFAKAGRGPELEEWIERGGGMLVTETAWGVLQLNRDLTIDSLAANRMFERAGLRYTTDAHSGYGPDKRYGVDRARLSVANAETALHILAGDQEGDTALAAQVVADVLNEVPMDSPVIRHALAMAEQHKDELNARYAEMWRKRLTPKDDPLACALIDLDSRLASELPPDQLRAHPSARAFPGPVGEQRAPRTIISIDPRIPGWHSTGTYAPPGELVTVRVPESLTSIGAHVQVGAWRDPHNHSHRSRIRSALRRYPIESTATNVASAIGGPIYIDLPEDFAAAQSQSSIDILIADAAPGVHYTLGETDLDAWRNEIRHREVPWAEFESDELIFTVPSSAVRDVEDPRVIMEHWNRVHEAMESLEPRTDNHWADRPYRYVADDSVSWGYMYCPANGPIVIPSRAAVQMFLPENFDAEGKNNLWGHYHEMGHAHQNPLWTDGATTEVTVNIFTVYALHVVNGYPIDSEVMRTAYAGAWKTFDEHRANNAKYEDVGGPFPRLQYFALLWHAFGFDAYHETFDRIRALPDAERPRDTAAERDRFVLEFGTVVQRNLVPYADAWGIDVTDRTRTALADYDDWLPEAPTEKRTGTESPDP